MQNRQRYRDDEPAIEAVCVGYRRSRKATKSVRVIYHSEMDSIDGKWRKSGFFQEFKRQKEFLNNTRRRVMRRAHKTDAEVVYGTTNEAEIDEYHCQNDSNDEEDF